MPEGLIIDPKQNPAEKDFGIIFCTDDEFPSLFEKHFIYRKSAQNYSRLYLAGEAIIFDKDTIEFYSSEQIIDGIHIFGEVSILCYDPDEAMKAPVIQHITRPHSPNARANAINHAITGGMHSPFGKMNLPAPNPPQC